MYGSTRLRSAWQAAAMAALASLLFVSPGSAHDDWDDWDDEYRDYYTQGDDGRFYDRHGTWPGPGHGAPVYDAQFDDLRGHGRWHWVSRTRQWMWFPYVDATWRPYFYGHWAPTSVGLTWVSYEPWGDVPHHYGQWIFVDHYGWGWVPGWEYAPAWVTWSVVDGYVGWAPCPPHGYRYPHARRYQPGRHSVAYGFGASYGYHASGIDFGLWVFVSDRDVCRSNVYSRAVPTETTLSLFKAKSVRPVGDRLSLDYVQRVSPEPIRTVIVDRKTKSVGGRSVAYLEPREQKQRAAVGREVTKRLATRTESPPVRKVSQPTGSRAKRASVSAPSDRGKEKTVEHSADTKGRTKGKSTKSKSKR